MLCGLIGFFSCIKRLEQGLALLARFLFTYATSVLECARIAEHYLAQVGRRVSAINFAFEPF